MGDFFKDLSDDDAAVARRKRADMLRMQQNDNPEHEVKDPYANDSEDPEVKKRRKIVEDSMRKAFGY